MSQAIFFPGRSPLSYAPSSPDPTPLRLIAFSVAEAALQPDPNSPSINMVIGKIPLAPDVLRRQSNWPLQEACVEDDWDEYGWSHKVDDLDFDSWNAKVKERRVKACNELPQSPPVSPRVCDFTVPQNSPLAESMSQNYRWAESPCEPAVPHGQRQLYTRSAEPSPIKSTFSGLDQTCPPPEFKPRLTAFEFDAKAKSEAATHKHSHARAKSEVPPVPKAHRMERGNAVGMRLPSLAEIQAKMRGQGASRMGASRMDSQESIELIQTPTEERPDPRFETHIALGDVLDHRPPTPPSPIANTVHVPAKDSRLAPFLRERTSGRLSGRPVSMPPLSLSSEQLANLAAALGKDKSYVQPSVMITPPKERPVTGQVPAPARPPLPRLPCSTSTRFANITITPPPRSSTMPSSSLLRSPRSPCSPSGSCSPTLSIPMITCTPAPATVIKDGKEIDSDEEEGDVVLFEGEVYDSESDIGSERDVDVQVDAESKSEFERGKEREREMRAEVMKKKLLQRRRSD
ncbi:uncharacterized protein L203_100286 [Cryptococcus depauperatus CBS 7841]|uniref:Uncharacterized protein n=1 Tax=Cryptococcus depauperatus CBS 7841 TaxID=1295531 RepID=A0A1E3IZ65_9TREE|nr:hypothetical protein L203_00056 [Cryptococcus depauperatus CBS 7841]